MLLSVHCCMFAVKQTLLFKELVYVVCLGKTCSREMRKTCWFFKQYVAWLNVQNALSPFVFYPKDLFVTSL